MIGFLAAEGGFGDPFPEEIPVLELFEFPALVLEGTPFAINRTVIIMLFASLLALGIMWVAFVAKRSIVPNKFQAACEAVVEFVREQIAFQVMGTDGRPYVPFLMSIFLFVWLNNLFEIVPFVNFPPTSRMAYPAMLAVIVWLVFIIVGVVKQGPRYFLEVAFPPGVPKAIYVLVTPIEIVSTFVVRPLTLAVRLFANMLAGHIILTIIFLTIHATLPTIQFPIGLVGLAAAPLLVGFEGVVGILQAYIFTILTAVYIGGSLHPEH